MRIVVYPDIIILFQWHSKVVVQIYSSFSNGTQTSVSRLSPPPSFLCLDYPLPPCLDYPLPPCLDYPLTPSFLCSFYILLNLSSS